MLAHRHTGSCHCQNITLVFESDQAPEAFQVRADNCSFCRRHHAVHISDPLGQLTFTVKDETRLNRYRFATRTADFLICRECGVYVGVVMPANDRLLSVLNVNVLDNRSLFSSTIHPLVLEHETIDERLKRRLANWTPAILTIAQPL